MDQNHQLNLTQDANIKGPKIQLQNLNYNRPLPINLHKAGRMRTQKHVHDSRNGDKASDDEYRAHWRRRCPRRRSHQDDFVNGVQPENPHDVNARNMIHLTCPTGHGVTSVLVVGE